MTHSDHLHYKTAWRDFNGGVWQTSVAVRDFIQQNYTPYLGDDQFLVTKTARTAQLWQELSVLIQQEQTKGVLDVSADIGSSILAHQPGYINKNLEKIVGLQTDARGQIGPPSGLPRSGRCTA